MKRGGPNHPKVHHLASLLGIERWGAVGILESLFHWTAQYAPDGNLGRWEPERIANGVGWSADPSVLVAGLEGSGWLDSDSVCTRRVHGWCEHADDATNMKLARSRQVFACGCAPRLTRLPKHEKVAAVAFYKGRAHGVHTACVNRVTSPPLPSPPLPSNENPPKPPQGGANGFHPRASRRNRPPTDARLLEIAEAEAAKLAAAKGHR